MTLFALQRGDLICAHPPTLAGSDMAVDQSVVKFHAFLVISLQKPVKQRFKLPVAFHPDTQGTLRHQAGAHKGLT